MCPLPKYESIEQSKKLNIQMAQCKVDESPLVHNKYLLAMLKNILKFVLSLLCGLSLPNIPVLSCKQTGKVVPFLEKKHPLSQVFILKLKFIFNKGNGDLFRLIFVFCQSPYSNSYLHDSNHPQHCPVPLRR